MKLKTNRLIQIVCIVAAVVIVTVAAFAPVFKQNELLSRYFPLVNKINLGLDLRGGVHVVLEAKDTAEGKVTTGKNETTDCCN